MSDIIRKEARLIILRALHEDSNYSASDAVLQANLDYYGIGRSREWVRGEIDWLVDMGAVRKTAAGTNVIVTLQPKGIEHVERRLTIEGIKRMSPASA